MRRELLAPPGPKPRFPGEHALALWRDPLGSLLALACEYGDVARWRFRGTEYILLVRPEHVQRVLVTDHAVFTKGRVLQEVRSLVGEGLLTSEGEVHRRQRSAIQPAFHHERIAGVAGEIVASAFDLSSRWRDGEEVDAHVEMTRLALAVVGRTLFGTDLDRQADGIRDALTVVLERQARSAHPLARMLERLPSRSTCDRRAHERLQAAVGSIIATGRANGAGHGHLLALLLDGSEREARDQMMTILLTGHETMATALTWTWALLARHPAVEAKLDTELAAVLDARPPAATDLPALLYTEMVLREALRLFPPVWRIGRRALVDYELDGYRIPAGSIVVLSPFVNHRDARFFPEPRRFDPERWTPGATRQRPRYSYFPFGGGPRVCIGEAFAWMEGKLLLATLARRWRLRPVAGRELRPEPLVTLRPKGGLPVTLEQR